MLLSPACASYDQYRDFEARGEHFRALVEAPDERARPPPAARRAAEQRAGDAAGCGRSRRRAAPPLEHRILLTATLCLLAFGAVMVYSASSPLGVLSGRGGTGTGEFVRYLIFGALGLAAMHVLSRRGLALLDRRLVNLLLLGSFALLLLVLVPGLRRPGQRRPALVRRGPDPVPALGADEARAGPVRGPLPRRAPEADARASPGGGADRGRRRRRRACWWWSSRTSGRRS